MPGAVEVAMGAVFGRVKFVVVSADVSVIGGIVDGAGVSPGAVMVDVDPLADPSCTTSYCCWPRCIVLVLRLQARARATIRSIRLRFILSDSSRMLCASEGPDLALRKRRRE